MSNTSTGLLARAEQRRIVELVGMNEVKFVAFPDKSVAGQITAVGVRQLSACSVPLIASNRGAIVAHIAPNEVGATDPDSYIQLAKRKMNELSVLYQRYSEYLGKDVKPLVIIATFQGNVVVPEQMHIMLDAIKKLGLAPALWKRSIKPQVDNNRPEGTVLVLGSSTTFKIFVEDQDVTNIQSDASSAESTGSGSSSGTPQQTWCYYNGREGYHLIHAGGTVISSRDDPPPHVPIRRVDAENHPIGWMMWDGTSWEVRND